MNNKVSLRDGFFMELNLKHRRLFVCGKVKNVYSSCGCLYFSCPFHHLTCDVCRKSYNISLL